MGSSKHVFFFLIMVWWCSCALASMASGAEAVDRSDGEEILSIGTSRITKGNLALAKNQAIEEALSKGVERDVARRLGREALIRYFDAVTNEILPSAREVIENFHVLAEDQSEDRYRLLIRLKVNDKLIQEKLRGLGAAETVGSAIRVLFLVAQLGPDDKQGLYWWGEPESDSPLSAAELALYRIFEEYGFNPVNRMLKIPDTEVSGDMTALDLSLEEAGRWGRAFSADLVIQGHCRIFADHSISVKLAAIDPEALVVLGRKEHFEPGDVGSPALGPGGDPLDTAIRKAVSGLRPSIKRGMRAADPDVARFEVCLENMRSFKQFREFKDFLEREVPGVKSVVQTTMRGTTHRVMVEFLGEQDLFLDVVQRHERLPFQVGVSRSESGEVVFRMRETP
ncbi:MAG: hypothetical protein ACOWYE_09955 [Desulfatiglandales bacterium]